MMRALRPDSFEIRRDELRQLVRRSREVVLLAAVTGVVTGLLVRGFEWLVDELYHRVLEAPLWLTAISPAIGLVVAALILKLAGGMSPSTSDEYLRAFHDPAYQLRPRYLGARIAAAIATLGSGGALGLEGPSLYGGSALGAMIQRRLPTPFRGSDHRTLLVAGARRGSRRSSRHRPPGRSSRSKCRTATIWRAACCCRRSWPARRATSRSSR